MEPRILPRLDRQVPADPTATPKGKPRRKPLPANLPRQETMLLPGDALDGLFRDDRAFGVEDVDELAPNVGHAGDLADAT